MSRLQFMEDLIRSGGKIGFYCGRKGGILRYLKQQRGVIRSAFDNLVENGFKEENFYWQMSDSCLHKKYKVPTELRQWQWR